MTAADQDHKALAILAKINLVLENASSYAFGVGKGGQLKKGKFTYVKGVI